MPRHQKNAEIRAAASREKRAACRGAPETPERPDSGGRGRQFLRVGPQNSGGVWRLFRRVRRARASAAAIGSDIDSL
jgi:hypothetical protein